MPVLNAQPLSSDEVEKLEEGMALFDGAKFWHAHEAWEDLWNMLKRRQAPFGRDSPRARIDSNGGDAPSPPAP